jgi:hypothetical protein
MEIYLPAVTVQQETDDIIGSQEVLHPTTPAERYVTTSGNSR